MELTHHVLSLFILAAVFGVPAVCVLVVNCFLRKREIFAPWWFLVMVAALFGLTGLALILHKTGS